MKNNLYLNGWGIAICLLLLSSSMFSQFTYECPPDINQIETNKSIQFISGTIENGTPLDFSTENCLNVNLTNDYNWTSIPITIENADRFVFEVDGLSINGVIAIYQEEFVSADYCNNLQAIGKMLPIDVGYTEFSPQMATKRVSVQMAANQSYVLMIADTLSGNAFQIVSYGIDGGLLNDITAVNGSIVTDLVILEEHLFGIEGTLSYLWDNEGATILGSIFDMESYQQLERGGLPAMTSSCASNSISVSSNYEETNDCGVLFIRQHFTITEDSQENCNLNPPQEVECEQILTFRKFVLDDIVMPNKLVNLVGTDNYPLDDDYRPHPSHTGYPFIIGGEEIYEVATIAVNVAVSYTDDTSEPGVMFREWQAINWCAPTQNAFFTQTILVDLIEEMEVVCPEGKFQVGIEKMMQLFELSPISVDNIIDLTDLACLSDVQTDFYYETHTFSVSEAGQYVFEISGLSENGLLAIYQNEPAIGEYCENILVTGSPLASHLGYTEFDVQVPTSRLVPYLWPGQNYTLLVADNAPGNTTQIASYALNGGVVSGLLTLSGTTVEDLITIETDDFLITGTLSYQWDNQGETISGSISDLESYQNMERAGLPMMGSDCILNGAMATDAVVLNGDCGNVIINRHYDINEDSEGDCNFNNPQEATCDQILTFRSLNIADIFLPNQIVNLGCTFYPLDNEGNPDPHFTGYPFVLGSQRKYELTQTVGNLAANYTDDTSVQGKVIREWRLLNWCDPSSLTIFHQTLIIDVDNEITLDCPADTDQISIASPVQQMSMIVDAGENEIDFTDVACLPLTFHDEYATQITEIIVDIEDVYIFEMEGLSVNDFAGIYRAPVDINNPCADILAVSKSSPNNTGFFFTSSNTKRLSAALVPGQTYYLLTAALGNTNVLWAIHSKNGGQIIGVQSEVEAIVFDLIHWDVAQLAIIEPQTYLVNNQGDVEDETISDELKNILDKTGYPSINSLLGNNKVTVSDEIIFNGDCEEVQIQRTFKVEEIIIWDCADTPIIQFCQQLITFRREQTKDIFWPVITKTLQCNDFFETDETGLPSVNETGFPFFLSAFHQIEINSSYSGNILNHYTLYDVTNTSVRRQWAVVNECSFADNGFFNQFINIDEALPILVCLPTNHYSGITHYTTNTENCTANVGIPILEYPNSCPSFADINVVVSHVLDDGTEEIITSVLNPQGVVIENLEQGFYYFKYTATDQNGDLSTLDCPFIVQDNTAPIPVCDDDLHISIGGAGTARVYAEDVDEGSYDVCGEEVIQVSRSGENIWREYVDFDCSDVSQEVTIFLLVWDDANGTGVFGDTTALIFPNGYTEMYGDNFSICEFTLIIEDKIRPYCLPPFNTNIYCTDEILNDIDYNNVDEMNEKFGYATADDNCEATTYQSVINVNLNDCGFGSIVRVFFAEDAWGLTNINACHQVIKIYETYDYYVKFPQDETIVCGSEPENIIQFESNSCSELSYSYHDEIGSTSSEGCRVIERTHSIVNTCFYDGISPAVIIGRDEDCDDNPGDEDVYILVKSVLSGTTVLDPVIYIDRDQDFDNNNPFFGNNRCQSGGPLPHGHWANSETNSELGGVGFYQYTQFLYLEGGDAPTINYPDAGEVICLGADDPCDLSGSPYFVVHPTCPVDLIDIHVYFDKDADGSIESEAIIFELDVNENGDIEVVFIPTLTEAGTYNVLVSVTDVCGSEGVLSFISIVEECDGHRFAGEIATITSLPIENIDVLLLNQGDTSNVYTNEEGGYEFCTISEGASFTVQPYLNSNHAQGISTLDIVRIYKHVLGIEFITNPYLLIAADVNNSNSITAMDAIGIQKLLLEQVDSFSNNTSWRFVDENYQFTSNNPLEEDFWESISFENYTNEVFDANFVGIKIGDVNASITPFVDEIEDARNDTGVLVLETIDLDVKNGEIFSFDIKIGENQTIEGVQGTLSFDSDALTLMGAENNTTSAQTGLIPFSWTVFQQESTVLHLSFLTKKAGKLSDFMEINSRLLQAFAIDETSTIHPVKLGFVSEIDGNQKNNIFELTQNYPNPFSKSTTISFLLEESEPVTILIQNLQGSIIKRVNMQGVSGQNVVTFNTTDFPTSGIYFYTLAVNGNRITKKMVFNE